MINKQSQINRKNAGNKNKLNVFMVGPHQNCCGGISGVISQYIDGLLGDKVNLYLVVSYTQGKLLKNIAVFFVSLIGFILQVSFSSQAIVNLHVSKNSSFYRKFIFFLASKLLRKKVIVHLHSSEFDYFIKKNKINKFFSQYMFTHASAIIVLSQLWKEKLQEFINNENIHVIYNPIDLKPEAEPVLTDEIKILFLGRLAKKKGIYDLIECIKRHKNEFLKQQIKFTLAGDGDLEKFQKEVQNNNLGALVKIPGWLNEEKKLDTLKSSHILILPSWNEQMPMSILEGMSHGLAILATSTGGIPELVRHGTTGFLFKPGDIDQLGQYLLKLASERELIRTMGKESRSVICSTFERSIILKQLVNLYNHISKKI
ncbi:glycosyltransferase family 4 protein [bacterium]|nr:glycosyltransferase family 4 protein [bacterium]